MPLLYSHGARKSHCSEDGFTGRRRPRRGHSGSEYSESCFSGEFERASTFSPDGMVDPPSSPISPLSCVKTPLSSTSHTEFNLVHHLHQISEDNTATVVALGAVFCQRDELTIPTIFSIEANSPTFDDEIPRCEVYQVESDASLVRLDPVQTYQDEDSTGSSAVWALLKVGRDAHVWKHSLWESKLNAGRMSIRMGQLLEE